MLAIQGAGEDLVLHDVDQRIDHRARCAPLVDDRRDRFGGLRVAAAEVFLGAAGAGVGELGDQITQAAHLLAFERERRQIEHPLHHPERRRGEGLAAERRQAVFDEQIELQAVRVAVPVQLFGQRQEIRFGAGVAVGQQDALSAIEITALRFAEEQQRRDHRGAARDRGFVLVLVENLEPALLELRIAVEMADRDHRRRAFDHGDRGDGDRCGRRGWRGWRGLRRRRGDRCGVRCGGRCRRRCGSVAELAHQRVRVRLDEVAREIANVEIFEQQRLRQRAEVLFKTFEDLEDEERIDAEFAERRFGIEDERRIGRFADQRLQVVFGALLQGVVVHHRSAILAVQSWCGKRPTPPSIIETRRSSNNIFGGNVMVFTIFAGESM